MKAIFTLEEDRGTEFITLCLQIIIFQILKSPKLRIQVLIYLKVSI